MIDQDPGHSDSVPLKSELQQDLKNSLACNVKDAASIECLKQENKIQQNMITLQKEKLKMLGEDWRQLCGEKRTLEKTFQTQLKEVGEDRSKLKSALTEENRLLHKSYSTEVRKREHLEAKSARDDRKISNLKRANNQLMVDLLQERGASNLIIVEAIVTPLPRH